MVAAAEAAKRGASVVLVEKNSKTGVKILMSGGTRCNLTQDTDARGIVSAFGPSGRFLQKSVGMFPPAAVVRMFSDLGVPTKVEPTGKIFPQSDRALHVRNALQRYAEQSGVQIRLRTGVRDLRREGERWCVQTHEGPITADRVIVTSGGKSWPGCGTTGDGYGWLQRVGHTIVSPRPALVPLVGGFSWTHQLSGVTLDDCVAMVRPKVGAAKQGKPLIRRRSSLLLTHFGFSGPAAMDVSGWITAADSLRDVQLVVDLLPDVSADQIRQQLTDRSESGGRSQVAAILGKWLPNRLAAAVAAESGCDCTVAELPRASAMKLIAMVKTLDLPITGTRGFEKAEVTAGGVSCSEVDPRTMASRVADNLYIAGEVLDVDGWIGGYNFQAAFSTGRAAGIAAAGG